MANPLKLFFSYSHKDEVLRDELGKHLKILEYQGLISSWYDRKIQAGDLWDDQINTNLETADIILLLISSDFIASSYCWGGEIKRAMELHEAGAAWVIPVILRSSDWTNVPFSKLQAVPKNAQPVTSLPDRDAAFQFVTQQIRTVATDLIQKRQQQREQQQKTVDIAAYRQRFEEYAEEGEISFGERFDLEELQKELKLTDAEVRQIEQSILNPSANPEQLHRYQQFFVDAVTKHGYPLSEKVQKDLKLIQKHLKLSDDEVAQVEALIIAQKIAEKTTAPEPTLATAASPQNKKANLSSVRFEVVTVNDQGKVVQRQQNTAQSFIEDLGTGISLEVVVIPGGTFWMGAIGDEGSASERPQHQVMVPEFWMGIYAVTQAQWKQVAAFPKVERDLDPDPAAFKGTKRPVEQVSWEEAVEFCARLSRKLGRDYRLPSEAEWEYACRANSTTPFYFGSTITPDLVNYDGNSPYGNAAKGKYREQTTEVGSFPPNGFGLYDMHGNVGEWCADRWHENYQGAPTDSSTWEKDGDSNLRLLRGGSWVNDAVYCRSAYRYGWRRGARDDFIGFRVVCPSPRTL